MQETSSSAIESLRTGSRVVAFGIAAIVLILLAAAVFLFLALPDANAFNARVERIFVENDALTTGAQIKLDKASTVDLGAAYIQVSENHIDNDQSALGRGRVKGVYDARVWILGAQYSMAF